MSAISHDVARSYQHYGRENLTDWELSALDAHVAACRKCQQYSQALESIRQTLQRLKVAQWGRIRPTDALLIRKIHARVRRNHARQQLSAFAAPVASVAVLVALVIAFEGVLLSLGPSPRPQALPATGPTLPDASGSPLATEFTEGAEPAATATFVSIASWSPRGFFPIASEAQAQAGFWLVTPAVPPLGYGLRCVTYVPIPRAVALSYAALDEPFPVVTITQWLGPTPPSDDIGIGVTARIVPTWVGDLDAEYVAGNWWFDYPTSTSVQGHWDATFPLARLRWVQNGHLMEIAIVDVADDTGKVPWYPPLVLVEIGETLRSATR